MPGNLIYIRKISAPPQQPKKLLTFTEFTEPPEQLCQLIIPLKHLKFEDLKPVV